MGNQQSNRKNNDLIRFKNQLNQNKHFQGRFIENKNQQQLYVLFEEMGFNNEQIIKGSLHGAKYSVNSLEFNDNFSFQKAHQILLKRVGASYPHVLNIKNIHVQEHKNLCSITRRIKISQQGYSKSLKEIIVQKSQQKSSFSQNQVVLILSKIVKALISMHDNQFKNIPLDTQALLFSQPQPSLFSKSQNKQQVEGIIEKVQIENYDCKIIDQDIVQINLYLLFMENIIENKLPEHLSQESYKKPQLYLSPELLEQSIITKKHSKNLTSKSDVFTLGMIIMEICCQEEIYFCYDFLNFTFDYESLIHRIAKISYSNQLKLLIAEMLQYDQNNRIGFVSLNQKLDKFIIKPFQETRKLKRKSSSTMLKQLLSCSRTSANNTNKQEKNVFDKIQFLKNSETQTKGVLQVTLSLKKDQSLRKSSSMISLKCKPSSFLTSKKVTLNRVNSNSNLKIEDKSITKRVSDTENIKIDYQSIIKNRIKTQPKLMDRPEGDLTTRLIKPQSESKFMNHQNLDLQNNSIQKENLGKIKDMYKSNLPKSDSDYIKLKKEQNVYKVYTNDQHVNAKKEQKIQLKERKSSLGNFSYVKRKVINLDKIHLTSYGSSSTNKIKKQKINNQARSIIQDEHLINQLDLSNKEQKRIKQNHNQITDSKQKISVNNKTKQIRISTIKRTLNLKQIQNSKSLKEQNSLSNKNWVIQKLKYKDSTIKMNENSNKLLNLKQKSNVKTKQTSLSRKKQSMLLSGLSDQSKNNILQKIKETNSLQSDQNINSVEKQTIKMENQLHQKERNSAFNKNDTIIKRLQLTEQKNEDLQLLYSRKQEDIKEQLQMVDNFLQKCNLSNSRQNDGIQNVQQIDKYSTNDSKEMKKSFIHDNYVKYSEFKQNCPQFKEKNTESRQQITVQKQQQITQTNKFKKKSKIIDIDLGEFSKPKLLNVQAAIKDESVLKKQPKKPSKLTKLKQLTIFTEQQKKDIESSQTSRLQAEQRYENKENDVQSNNKENDMQSSNLPNHKSQMNKNIKTVKQTECKPQSQNHGQQPRLEYASIPYQRIEYITLNRMQQHDMITPNNLTGLNKMYGKGIILNSVEQSQGHKKDFSTLTKPFQQIQLNYTGNQPYTQQLSLKVTKLKQTQEMTWQKPLMIKENHQSGLKNSEQSSTKKSSILLSINADQLTFRLKPKSGQFALIQKGEQKTQKRQYKQQRIQKVNHFQKQNGSFVLRQQNPLKNIQSLSIINQDRGQDSVRNTVEQLFKQSTNKRKIFMLDQNIFQGYHDSFQQEGSSKDAIAESQQQNSSCNSIDLSQIQARDNRHSSFLLPQNDRQRKSSSRRKKHKHVSILEPDSNAEQKYSRGLNIGLYSRGLNIDLKNINTIGETEIKKNSCLQTIRSSRPDEYNTFRSYLQGNQFASRVVELDQNFVYEGEVNQDGQFQGNGMIYRRDQGQAQSNNLVYTGSFVNGLYHGFGTLYQIQDAYNKVIKLPNTHQRMSFGSPNLAHQLSHKYYSLSPQPVKYEGQFFSGKLNGFGTYFYQNGDKFSGCFKNGVIQGYGMYHFVNHQDMVSGMWKNNIFEEC